MMKKKYVVQSIIILTTIFLNACNNNFGTTPTPSGVSVISFKENFDALQEEARTWQNDTYLAWAQIPLRMEDSGDSVVIAAEFYSPNIEFESLGVELSLDGSITSEPVKYEVSIFQREPIALSDWELDSGEALDIMLDKEGMDFLKSNKTQCSFLMLERDLSMVGQPVVWRLTLMDCLGSYVRQILIDPISGEFLEND